MKISTHVLDTSQGRPAAGVRITLEWQQDGDWVHMVEVETDRDGRTDVSIGPESFERGMGDNFRLRFATGAYFGGETFYPEVLIAFRAADPRQDYHVPLLISPFGYSTYRGS